MKNFAIYILIIACVCLLLCSRWTIHPSSEARGVTENAPLTFLPSLMQIQKRLGVEPDGIPGPVTMKAWKLAINQQFADPYFEGSK